LLISKTITQCAELERELKRMKTYVEIGEVTLMEKAATNLRDRLLIRLLFHLGCRVSEALALAVEDIDFNHGTIIIQHLKASLKLYCSACGQRLGRTHTFCPKCGSKVEKAQVEQQERRRRRVLPVDSDTLGMLGEYVRRDGPVLRDGRKLIFSINRHRGWQVIKGCAERANLPKLVNPETGRIHNVSPHKLRDAFAVRAIKMDDSGDGLRLLQQHLGHASFNTTAKYRKVSGEEHKEWYQKLWEKGIA
jgi:integrase/recombinase XerD